MITQNDLRNILDYNPATGLFSWRKGRGPVRKGQIAGSVDGKKAGYIEIRVDGYLHKAHRLAWLYMYGDLPEVGIDHINGDPGDNRIHNLRLADQKVNCRNARINARNTSGHPGVCWDKRYNKWYARVHREDGKCLFLGYFDGLIDAVAERKRHERIHGYHPNHGRP